MTARGTLLLEAIEQRRQANARVSQLLHEHWPAGTPIAWAQHKRVFRGHVVQTLYGERLEVENRETGKRRVIRAIEVADAAGFN